MGQARCAQAARPEEEKGYGVSREPGLYPGIPNSEYQRGLIDPRPLSWSTGKLLALASPAEFQHALSNPVHKAAFDEGQAVHELVLEGEFKTVVELPFDDLRTKAAKEARDEAYAAGLTPMKSADLAPIHAMAEAVRNSALASSVLTSGEPEVSALALDADTGVMMQARFDWLRDLDSRRPIIVDLKTTARGVDPRSANREIADRHYHGAAAYYARVLRALGYPDPVFLFIFVSKAAPHLVSVTQLSLVDRQVGDLLVDKMLSTFTRCTAAGVWPGHDTEIHTTQLPIWSTYEAEELTA